MATSSGAAPRRPLMEICAIDARVVEEKARAVRGDARAARRVVAVNIANRELALRCAIAGRIWRWIVWMEHGGMGLSGTAGGRVLVDGFLEAATG